MIIKNIIKTGLITVVLLVNMSLSAGVDANLSTAFIDAGWDERDIRTTTLEHDYSITSAPAFSNDSRFLAFGSYGSIEIYTF